MSDTPKLVVLDEHYPSSQTLQRQPSVPQIMAWLQEQNVGEEKATSLINVNGVPIRVVIVDGLPGRYLVVPLDPKEGT